MINKRRIGVLLSVLSFGGCEIHDSDESTTYIKQVKTNPSTTTITVPELAPYHPVIYQAMALRDPFTPASRHGVTMALTSDRTSKQIGTLSFYALSDLYYVGSIETSQLWALIRTPEAKVYRVGLGDTLGMQNGQIISINHSRLVVREQVKNQAGEWMQQDTVVERRGNK